jgi:hypothetical protein
VAAVVEVKSKLTTKNLDEAIGNLHSSCRGLEFGSGAPITDEKGYRPPHTFTSPCACILAFDSEVATERLTETLKVAARVWDIVCVLGEKGGLYVVGQHGNQVCCGLHENAERLLTFSVLLRDNVQNIRASRGTPPLEHYVAQINSRLI